MSFDRVFEPVVRGGRMFVAFNDTDRVVALDVETGEHRWVHLGSNVRNNTLAVDDGRVFFAEAGVTDDDRREALADQIKDRCEESSQIYPDITHVRSVSRAVAIAVAREAIEQSHERFAQRDFRPVVPDQEGDCQVLREDGRLRGGCLRCTWQTCPHLG